LLNGSGRFTDDIRIGGQVHAAFLRSPMGHAEIRHIDCGAARAMPGVLGIFSGADLAAAGLGPIPPVVALPGRDGKPMFAPPIPVLANGRVRYVGEPIALVVAETYLQACDAAEAIEIDLDPLPAVADVAQAGADGAQAVWPEAPDNVALDWAY